MGLDLSENGSAETMTDLQVLTERKNNAGRRHAHHNKTRSLPLRQQLSRITSLSSVVGRAIHGAVIARRTDVSF